MAEQTNQNELLALTTNIVTAHVSHNETADAELLKLIRDVYDTIASLGNPVEPAAERPTPAVPIKKSVTPNYVICLEDGKKLKMLKRHLKSAFNLTPEEYRKRWGLPADYPMVAPNYAKQRSKLAREFGLGRPSNRKSRSEAKT